MADSYKVKKETLHLTHFKGWDKERDVDVYSALDPSPKWVLKSLTSSLSFSLYLESPWGLKSKQGWRNHLKEKNKKNR